MGEDNELSVARGSAGRGWLVASIMAVGAMGAYLNLHAPWLAGMFGVNLALNIFCGARWWFRREKADA